MGTEPAFRILASLKGYSPAWLSHDIMAGLAVAAVSLPTAIAYPAIVGLPPETGLYASMAALIGYAVFGPSPRLMMGPDAATMTVLGGVMAGVMGQMPAATAADRVEVAALIAICVGLICLLARLLRLGAVASLLSRPILLGFFAGVSVSILVGQIGRVTGVKVSSDGMVEPFVDLARQAGDIHWPSVLLAGAMFAVLQIARVVPLGVPGPVIVLALAGGGSAVFGFEGLGIAVVGDIPSGMPGLGLPWVADLPVGDVLLGSVAVFLVAFGAGIITARSFGAQSGDEVDANDELVGFGAANLMAGLMGAFPVTSSDSRTAVNLSVGGRSQVTGLAAVAALGLALAFFSDLLRILPIPALGAILVSAAIGLIDLASLRQIWRVNPVEFLFALSAMAGAISFGVLQGVIVAIVGSLTYLLYKDMQLRVVLLGRMPGREGFYKLHRFPKARAVPGMTICFIQGSLLFFNTDAVKTQIMAIVAAMPAEDRWLVFDASAISQIDITAAAMLGDLRRELEGRGIRIAFAEVHAEVKALMDRAGLTASVGPGLFFDDIDDVIPGLAAIGPQDSANGAQTT